MQASVSLRLVLILGLLSAIGPFAIDMYLPALPQIGSSLGAEVGAVQASLTAFFLSIGVGQLLYGPVSDMLGRKPPLYFGLTVFAAASVGCALAPNIETMVAFRFVQGLGAAACMAVPRAVVRDLHTGHAAARMMSLLMLVFSVSPILAPLAGSGVIAIAGWRAVFWVVAGAALLGLIATWRGMEETRTAEARLDSSLGGALKAYLRLLRDRHYLGLVFIGGCAMAGFFVYLAGSPFVLINYYGLSSTQYSMAFALNSIAFIGAAQLTGRLGQRFGLVNVVKAAASASGVTMASFAGVLPDGGRAVDGAHRAVLYCQCLHGAGDSHDFGAGAGRAWRDCRYGFGFAGHFADAQRCSRHADRRAFFQWQALAHGGGHGGWRVSRCGADLDYLGQDCQDASRA